MARKYLQAAKGESHIAIYRYLTDHGSHDSDSVEEAESASQALVATNKGNGKGKVKA